jgi:hypothetical protein
MLEITYFIKPVDNSNEYALYSTVATNFAGSATNFIAQGSLERVTEIKEFLEKK